MPCHNNRRTRQIMRLTLTFRDIDPGPVTARSETAHTTLYNCGDGRDCGGAQDHRDSVTGKHIRVEVGTKSRCDARKNSSLPRPSRAVQAAHKGACAWAARGEPKARRGRVAGPDGFGREGPPDVCPPARGRRRAARGRDPGRRTWPRCPATITLTALASGHSASPCQYWQCQ